MDKLLLFDTSIGSDNIGDQIIMDYCEQQLRDTSCSNMFIYKAPTHLEVGKSVHKINRNARYSIVCGTNILKTTILINQLWKLSLRNVFCLRNICLMGVGWHNYVNFNVDIYTKWVYRMILSNRELLSVRDKYTAEKLYNIGIKNVVFTACPTMWNLTPDFCEGISRKKSKNVITTLTYYKKDEKRDRFMIDTLLNNYGKVYFFAQQAEDLNYLIDLGYLDRVDIIKSQLFSYDEILQNEDVDFIGTRLHAGIRALNFKRRSMIIAVDNRATEINRDTNLPVLSREDIDKLPEYINNDIITNILLPVDNITRWKNQFV